MKTNRFKNYSFLRTASTFVLVLATLVFVSCKKDTPVDTLELSTTEIKGIPVEGGTASFTITTNTAWSAVSDREWCHIGLASGEGAQSIVVTIDPSMESTSRTATITVVAGSLQGTVSVTQFGFAAELTVAPTTISGVIAEGSTKSFVVTTNTSWSATSSGTWCQISPSAGTASETVTVTLAPNTTANARTATIVVSAFNLSSTVTVSQVATKTYSRTTDSLALVDFYNATGMAQFASSVTWNLNAPLPTSGTNTAWKGVRVNAQGRVDSIWFASGVIPASVTNAYIPESIGDLNELKAFVMSSGSGKGQLNGAIPERFWYLTKLRFVTLTNNNLSGTIPSTIGNLVNMEKFLLNATSDTMDVTGAVPAEIGLLTKMTDFNISGTRITSLPLELRNCIAMQNFNCFNTQITSLPEIFGNWPDVGTILLHKNSKLTGPLPTSIGTITNTTKASVSIHLYECNFTGSIPASWANITSKCGQLRIQTNQLSGEIPAEVKAHAKWSTWTPASYICPQRTGFGFTNCD